LNAPIADNELLTRMCTAEAG